MATAWMQKIRGTLFKDVDLRRLAYFRICFGIVTLWETADLVFSGWARRFYLEPAFHFTYYGFEWVRPLPPFWMYLFFAAMAAASVLIACGLWFRAAAAGFFVLNTYLFLIDQTAHFYNHIYLFSLFSLLLCFSPAANALSLDARWHPETARNRGPYLPLLVLRLQMAVVYFFAGIAKINVDWLSGFPIESRLIGVPDAPLLVLFRKIMDPHALSVGMAYAGMFFDLLIVPALLWKRTRLGAYVAAISFHFINASLFSVGTFPWIGLAGLFLFPPLKGDTAAGKNERAPEGIGRDRQARMQNVGMALAAAFVAVQLFLPLRHFLYPGEVRWTKEGFKFSWRMIIDTSRANVKFFVSDPRTGKRGEVDVAKYLPTWQQRELTDPELALQFAHFLAAKAEADGIRVGVYADIWMSLSGRPPQRIIDPNTDLAKAERTLAHRDWVLPLTSPALGGRERMEFWKMKW